MRIELKCIVLALLACVASAACDSGSDNGAASNANDGRNSNDAGGRGTVGLDNLVDAAVHRDGGGELNPFDPDDAGDGATAMPDDAIVEEDGSTSPTDGGPLVDDLTIPADPGERGPWPVGVRTAQVALAGGQMPAEIWYPAVKGSDAGKVQVVYDFITWYPPQAQAALPMEEKPAPVVCDCYRDLPFDAEHGPYPVSIFVHNIGAFRTSSAGIMAHWASRGFIVVALDHPRLTLQDVLAYASVGRCTSSGISQDGERDIAALLTRLRAPAGDFAFLSGAVDATRVAVSGHGEGAEYAVRASGEDGVRLIMQWNHSLKVTKQGDVEAVAYFTGAEDHSAVGAYSTVDNVAIDAPRPSLFVGTDNTGNLSMTELCNAKNSLGRDGMAIASRYELCDIDYTLLSAGWDCNVTLLDQPSANAVFGLATTAALEQFLKGIDHSATWDRYRQEHGDARVLR